MGSAHGDVPIQAALVRACRLFLQTSVRTDVRPHVMKELRAANRRESSPVHHPEDRPLANGRCDLIGEFLPLLSQQALQNQEVKPLLLHKGTEIFISIVFIHSLYSEAVLKVPVKAEPASSAKTRCYRSEIISVRTDPTKVTLIVSRPQLSQLPDLIFAFLPLSRII